MPGPAPIAELTVGDVMRRGQITCSRGASSQTSTLCMGFATKPVERIAGDVATTDLVTVDPTDALETAVRLMTDCGTAHLVVVSSRQGRPLGMISSLDLARALSS